MARTYSVIYENGIFRPVGPVSLPEGQPAQVVVPEAEGNPKKRPGDPRETQRILEAIAATARRTADTETEPGNPQSICQALQEIANRPLEGKKDAFSGRDHDAVLYPKTGRMP